MPHITIAIDPEGLLLDVMIGLTGKDSADLLSAGRPIARPFRLRGEIDTGSDITCITARVLRSLGLTPVNQATTHTTGGPIRVNLFDVSLSIPPQGLLTAPLLVLEHLPVVEWLHPPAGIEVLVGRDVLKHLLIIHDGQRDVFTLAD